MNRRDFFKISSFALGAAAVAGISGGAVQKVLGAAKMPSENFSIELITDSGDKAIKLVEAFIDQNNFSGGVINFSEYRSWDTESGDIVLLNKGKLVNYKSGSDEMSKGLKEIASSLALPKVIENPVRLRFSSAPQNESALRFLVFHKERLIQKISADTMNRNISINGSKGEVSININGSKARVTKSSCTHKNCINSGSISLSGESIVCIPNEVHVIAE